MKPLPHIFIRLQNGTWLHFSVKIDSREKMDKEVRKIEKHMRFLDYTSFQMCETIKYFEMMYSAKDRKTVVQMF